MRLRTAPFLLPLLAFVVSVARADVDVEVANGDQVTGTLNPITETEAFRFRIPKGAVIAVLAKTVKKGPELHVALEAPGGAPIGAAIEGRSVKFAKVTAAASGVHVVRVSAKAGAVVGDYTLQIVWKSPPGTKGTLVNLGAAATASVTFSADAGATATVTLKKPKTGPDPKLAAFTTPGGPGAAVAGLSAVLPLAATGDYAIDVRNDGTAGDVPYAVKIKAPKLGKRKLALTGKSIGSGNAAGDRAYSEVVGPDGGRVVAPVVAPGAVGEEINGSSVDVPKGALPVGTSILIGTAPALAPGGGDGGAGPTVYFGPEGQTFGTKSNPASVKVTIPFDATYAGLAASLVVYTRDAKGVVAKVAPPYEFNAALHTISFFTSHFSSFRAAVPGGTPLPDFVTLASAAADARDVAYFNGPVPSPPQPRVLAFVAGGNSLDVQALVAPTAAGGAVESRVFAGGGGAVADGAFRTQFRFLDPVTSVYALPSGDLYVATSRQIFQIDPQGLVFRVAGTGSGGDTGDGGPALNATFSEITDILVTLSGDVFVADAGAGVHRIRQVDHISGNVRAWAGASTAGGFGADGGALATTRFFGPFALEFSGGSALYVADGGRIRKIAPAPTQANEVNLTIVGDGSGGLGFSGDGGTATAARFQAIKGFGRVIDPASQNEILYVADSSDHTVRRVDLTANSVSLLLGVHQTAGFGGDAVFAPDKLYAPLQIAAVAGRVLVVDRGNGRIREASFTQP